ncbi:hypothetical protein FQR65_LT12965 [Abscondita terminalis]|nr:hypothetical protein FQR65_LT12965 [Abscondita terminalis]
MEFALSGIFLIISIAVASEDDWLSKCGQCKCLWSDGKKTADCSNKHLSSIPTDLSDQIRSLDLSNNPLYELKPNAFAEGNLLNIQKLKLQNCSIEEIHPKALSNLGNLIELDLSKNNIKKLDQNLFRECVKLRVLFLNYNKLKELRGSLFHNMPHLQRVSVNNNKLEKVDGDVFDSGPVLLYIDLSENKLKYLDYQIVQDLKKISSINVQGNLWVCDCTLKKFRDFVMDHTLVTTPTVCAEPERLKGRLWSDLQSKDFACTPEILEPALDRKLEVDAHSNYTISCKVRGDPIPDVDWVTNGRIIDQDPRQNQPKYVVLEDQKGDIIWNNLTIMDVSYRDKGDYKCVAKNPGGVEERNISLIVYGDSKGGIGFGGSSSGSDLFLYIGLTVGAVVLIVIIFILICCYCKRSTRQPHSKNNDANQSTDYISLNGRQEHEKALITEVNPLVKPPRQYSVPPSVTSGVTEVSDFKKTLLDDDSTFGVGDEDSRSFDYDSRPRIPIHHLDADYRVDQQPDLLSFPARGVQVSPAGSTASTVADHSRLPPHHGPQSPLHSPLYDHINLYRTLPYSRSQSPFTTPLGAPVVTPRAGAYVTIPRRPRASWSSEPLNPMYVDPVYDNLGRRTTASGNSALSLNKLGEGTPKIARPTPSTTSYASAVSEPISENDNLGIPLVAPRNLSVAQRALSPTNEHWYRNGSETSSIRSVEPDSRRQSTSSLLPATPDGKITKIPPRPPPKPKKRVSTGPLFEDEGEDGTEV